MLILVVSDNHGDRDVLVDLVETYQGKVDGMFHCGDSELEATDTIWKNFYVVRGNCDYDDAFPTTVETEIKGEKIFMTHGHLHEVKFTMNTLLLAAKEAKAQFAFFGHTHELGVEVVDDVLLLNPGSIRLPRGKYPIKTYAMIETTPEKITVNYYDETHKVVSELAREFKR
ncbi:YfcE family phosphodiesterase [Carnobacterium divergens]|uniref:metallophosphoesterase n=1 Tax=Carnobacterium divergens TaxID=2748 RepID=UPI0010724436|nr:metallophosphoesterase [Carnobacterium divergens]TFI61305.1 YfcE family phosphodiesterase [Carnobacterium divergens]TFI88327.1 YfcE family phosphodiesterase [Carnobacterium divergens]TFJ02895.1 YfcE family phosphodiesterase [Carnobacterium divergens]TFJ04444.1 YfcE family phosphodiesterase [Carnobacterium divergens]